METEKGKMRCISEEHKTNHNVAQPPMALKFLRIHFYQLKFQVDWKPFSSKTISGYVT